MSALVPYSRVVTPGRLFTSPRMATAIRVGRYVYKNKGRVKKAAQAVQRAYRGYRRRFPQTRAEGVGRAPASVEGYSGSTSDLEQGTLYIFPVEFPSVDNAANSYRARYKDRLFFRGLKVCDRFSNENLFDIELHWALLQLKKEFLGESTEDLRLNFFRDNESLDDRSLNFQNGSWDYRHACNGINKDKWNIITHRKMVLGKSTGDSNAQNRSVRQLHKYFPIKKSVLFDKPDSKLPTKPFFICYWLQSIKQSDFEPANRLSHIFQRRIYYSETKK